MSVLTICKPIEKSIKAGHPWIFRDALKPFDLPIGSVVTVNDSNGKFLCGGLVDSGAIAVRVFVTKNLPITELLFKDRIYNAIHKRTTLYNNNTTALRLIHGESDYLPGIVLDRYGEFAVLVIDGSALSKFLTSIFDILEPILKKIGIQSLLLRTRSKHEKKVEPLWGDLPKEPVIVLENGMKLLANLTDGQKTGLFLDHRDSRLKVRGLAAGKRVLNLYGYSGGFSVAAGLGDADAVTTVDIAPEAIKLAAKNWEINGLNPKKHRAISADVPEFLRSIKNDSYSLIIADPPSFAPNHKSVENAVKSYQLLHASCMKLIAQNGQYIAASCSSHIRSDLFQKTILEGAKRANKVANIVSIWGAGLDHPTVKGFPEGEYLKVFLVEVLNKSGGKRYFKNNL